VVSESDDDAVERYEHFGDYMESSPHGEWVSYEDYQALAADRIEALQAQLEISEARLAEARVSLQEMIDAMHLEASEIDRKLALQSARITLALLYTPTFAQKDKPHD
jgi:ParB-like chromosome segregation protein Spo0J